MEVSNFLTENQFSAAELDRWTGPGGGAAGWQEDTAVPAGWKVGGAGIMSPTGAVYPSLEEGLADEGWVSDPALPPDWLKLSTPSGWTFLTDQHKLLGSSAEVLKHFLLTRAPQEVVRRFSAIMSEQPAEVEKLAGPRNKPRGGGPGWDTWAWQQDPALPPGWRTVKQQVRGVAFTRFLSPGSEGKYFSSRAQAAQFLLSSGQASQQEVEMMRSSFQQDGFTSHPDLPADWLRKENHFISEAFVPLRGNDVAVQHLREGGYRKEVLARFEEKVLHRTSCDSLPAGWKLVEVEMTSGRPRANWPPSASPSADGDQQEVKCTKFLSPDGKELSSRAQVNDILYPTF